MKKRILQVRRDFGGVFADLQFDVSKQPEGPVRDRLESIAGTIEEGKTPSREDSAFAENHLLWIGRHMPYLLEERPPIEL